MQEMRIPVLHGSQMEPELSGIPLPVSRQSDSNREKIQHADGKCDFEKKKSCCLQQPARLGQQGGMFFSENW